MSGNCLIDEGTMNEGFRFRMQQILGFRFLMWFILWYEGTMNFIGNEW